MSNIREYGAAVHSTDTFGRMLANVRDQHLVIDGPPWNGCPGEAWTPGELFVAAVAACGVEQLQMFAGEAGLSLQRVQARISGWVDRDHPVREDRTVFNGVTLEFAVTGISQSEAEGLVELFKGRCPLFGTLSLACPALEVRVVAEG